MTRNKEPQVTDAAAIAEGLSEAQKAVLLRPIGTKPRPFYPGLRHQACRALVAGKLLTETTDILGNPMFRFTAEGLAVRKILQERAA